MKKNNSLQKIESNFCTNRTHKIDIKNIISNNINNVDALHNIITIIYNVDHKNGLRYGGGEIAINTNDNECYISNYNPNKTNIPNGNLNAQLKKLTENKQGFERVNAQLQILRSIGVDTPANDTNSNFEISYNLPKPKRTKPTTQKKTKKENISLSYEVASINSTAYKYVLNYFDQKCGIITPNELNSFGIIPIKSKSGTTKNGKQYTFKYGDTPSNIAFVYKNGKGENTSEFLKQPYDKVVKFMWLKKPKYYTYLLDYCLNSDCHTCIICGGQDDAICINLYFQYSGICAVAVGGEARIIPTEIIKPLKDKFKHLAFCFDYDNESEVGQQWSIKNSEHHNIPSINLSSTTKIYNHKIYKDICEMHKNIYLVNPTKFINIGIYLFTF